MKKLHRVAVACAIALLLTACDFGGNDGATGAAGATGSTGAVGATGSNGATGTDGTNSLVDVVPQPAGMSCHSGGEKILTGLDIDGDGILESTEMTSTSYVCNGADGASTAGINSLVAIVVEPAGANCANGGQKVTSGLDTSPDGVLDASEVTSTVYVCNGGTGATGAMGTTGATGSSGLNSLVNIVSEPAGASCTNGGEKVTSGLDADKDGVLQSAEVTSTNYVCNGINGNIGANGAAGSAGLNSLVDIISEAAGANCTYGGRKITSGLDINSDGTLQNPEITTTSYVCNGAPGPGVTWVDVSNTSTQAHSNTGYLADNAARVVVTLPASPVVGDLVQVSGIGAGGWQIAQNAGQSITTSNVDGGAFGVVWVRLAALDLRAVASSADGTHLVGVEANGYIWTSTDSGASWNPQGATTRNWYAVASSADGTHLVAVEFGGQIYTSVDSGASWIARDSARNWEAVASSADGTRLIAAEYGGLVYTSADAGATWTPGSITGPWDCVTSSADGAHLVAGQYLGQLYTSPDYGATWIARDTNKYWWSLASSADGTHLIADAWGEALYTSSDSGVTWTVRGVTPAPTSVASSNDGTRLLAAANGGTLYTSNDAGVTWTSRATSAGWTGVASSADASKLIAVASSGALATSTPTPVSTTTSGSTGWIAGEQYSAIDLQYAGNNVFMVRSSSGLLDVQ